MVCFVSLTADYRCYLLVPEPNEIYEYINMNCVSVVLLNLQNCYNEDLGGVKIWQIASEIMNNNFIFAIQTVPISPTLCERSSPGHLI